MTEPLMDPSRRAGAMQLLLLFDYFCFNHVMLTCWFWLCRQFTGAQNGKLMIFGCVFSALVQVFMRQRLWLLTARSVSPFNEAPRTKLLGHCSQGCRLFLAVRVAFYCRWHCAPRRHCYVGQCPVAMQCTKVTKYINDVFITERLVASVSGRLDPL